MFRASKIGVLEGMQCWSLTGTANLRRYLVDHLDTVQLSAAAGMPEGEIRVSLEPRGAVLLCRLSVPFEYCVPEEFQMDLSFEKWVRADKGDFEFLFDRLMQAALRLLIVNPAFFHTRLTQYRRLYLYTLSKPLRQVLAESFAAYQQRAGSGDRPMDEIFRRFDSCLMLRRSGTGFVLSCVSDEKEVLLGTYAEESLFRAADCCESTESLLWRYFNEYMRDRYGVKIATVMLLKFGSRLHLTEK